MVKIVITDNKCTKCGTCVLACPYHIFVQKDSDSTPMTEFKEPCVSCGHCVAICPSGAIAHSGIQAGRIKPIDQSLYPVPEQVHCLLRSRRSIRAFEDTPVERELIEQIIDGANTGPSPHNAHRVGYVAVQDRAIVNKILALVAENNGRALNMLKNPAILDSLPVPVREKMNAARPLLPSMERVFNSIEAGDDMMQRGTPSLLVLYAPKAPNDFWGPRIDTMIAIQNASLMCCGLGLGCCESGYIEIIADKDPGIQHLLGIPDDHAIYGMLAVGYPKYTFENWIEKEPAKVTWM